MSEAHLHQYDGHTFLNRAGGYLAKAHARPYGLLLIADPPDNLRNWTVAARDAEQFRTEWEPVPALDAATVQASEDDFAAGRWTTFDTLIAELRAG